MIPKVIHYCWFGGKNKPKEVEYCIDTWKKKLKGYKLIEWNESNFDIASSIDYVRKAYENKKWAFVSDYVRLLALYNYGGIYLDTDVEVFKTFNKLLKYSAFFGYESKDYVCTAVMGAERKSGFIKEFIDSYENMQFANADYKQMVTNVQYLTELLRDIGLQRNGKKQIIDNMIILPQVYFSDNAFINIFGKYSHRSIAYHHFFSSWYDNRTKGIKKKLKYFIVGKLRNTIGTDFLAAIRKKMR